MFPNKTDSLLEELAEEMCSFGKNFHRGWGVYSKLDRNRIRAAGPVEAEPVGENSCFVDRIAPPLIGCACNAPRLAIRKGFVDKAAAVPQLGGDLAYSAPL